MIAVQISPKIESLTYGLGRQPQNFKVSTWPKGFFRFWYLYNIYKCFKPQKVNSDAFWHKIKLKISGFGHAQWSWLRNERLVMNAVTLAISQSFMFLLCLFDDRIASPTSVCLFFVGENSSPSLKQQLPELEGFLDSWLRITTHSETQSLFCTDSRSISLGVAEAGTLNLDLKALKSQNPIFFLEYFLTHYRATI